MRSSEHLHRAVTKGDCETVESILAERCMQVLQTNISLYEIAPITLIFYSSPHYLNALDKNGCSPLMSAAKTNQKKWVTIILLSVFVSKQHVRTQI